MIASDCDCHLFGFEDFFTLVRKLWTHWQYVKLNPR